MLAPYKFNSFLHSIESIFINDRFMSIFYSLPLGLVCFFILSSRIKSLPLLSMNNISNIVFSLKYLFYMRIMPFPCFFGKLSFSCFVKSVFRWRKDSFALHGLCNTAIPFTIQKHIENPDYIVRYFFINQKFSRTIRGSVIDIWRGSFTEISLRPYTMLSGFDFL